MDEVDGAESGPIVGAPEQFLRPLNQSISWDVANEEIGWPVPMEETMEEKMSLFVVEV